MIRYIRFSTFAACLSFLLLASTNLVSAQPGNPSSDPDNPTPITGIEILLGAGAFIGAKKLLNRNKKQDI